MRVTASDQLSKLQGGQNRGNTGEVIQVLTTRRDRGVTDMGLWSAFNKTQCQGLHIFKRQSST